MKEGQLHPAGARSRRAIIDSLLDLMEREPFDGITVSQIAGYAGITRRTFYAHFRDRETALLYRIGELKGELLNTLLIGDPKDLNGILQICFRFWGGHRHFLLLLHRHRLLHFIQAGFDGFTAWLRDFYTSEAPRRDEKAGYSSALLSGILWGLLRHWVETGASETPDELIACIAEIIRRLDDALPD